MKNTIKVLLIAILSFGFFSIQAQQDTFPSNIIITDIDGNTHDIDLYLQDGKHVVLQVFQTWCPICWDLYQSEQIVNLNNAYGSNGTDEMVVLMIEGWDNASNECNGIPALQGDTCSVGNWIVGNTIPIIQLDSITSQLFIDTLTNYNGVIPYVLSICSSQTYEYWQGFSSSHNTFMEQEIIGHFNECAVSPTCDANVTSEEATIIIPSDSSPTLLSNGNLYDTIPEGTIIQVVYELNGEKKCAGQAIWEGESTYISVVGNDAIAPEVNGYMEDEEYEYCFILPSGCVIENVSATYLSSPFFDAAGNYTSDGTSGIATLSGNLDFSIELQQISPDTCDANTGAYLVTSANGVAPISYTWSNGVSGELLDGLSAGDSYGVQAIDGNGCPAVIYNNPEIPSSPCPQLQCNGNCNGNPSSASGCAPFTVEFNNGSTSSAGIDSLVWKFGDGGLVINEENPTYTYDTAGTYTATLLIFDGFSYDSTIFQIEVLETPEISAESIIDYCFANQVTLSASSTLENIANWEWSVDQGNISSTTSESTNVLQFSPTSDDSEFSLIAIATNGCQDTTQGVIEIGDFPFFSLEQSSAIQPTCNQDNGLITVAVNNGISPVNYYWSHDSNLNDSTATDLPSGNYEVIVSDGNGCSAFVEIVLEDETTVDDVDLGQDTSWCDNGSTLLLSAGNTGTEYLWYLDGAIIPNANQGELIVDESGAYSVEMTNPDGCVSTDVINVQINSFPNVPTLQDTFICDYEYLPLNVGCEDCIYNWSNGETDSLVYLEGAGNYEVTVTNINSQCSVVESFNLEIITVQIPLEQQYYFCDTDFPNTINAGNTTNDYTWYNGNSIVGNENELEVFFPGVYHVVVTNFQGCSASATTYVEENPPPDVPSLDNVSICEGDELFLDVTCSNNCSYFWNSGLESPTITLNETGFYEVTVIDNTTGCYAIESMNLNVIDYPTISQDTSFCNGENITLFAGNTGTEYLWYLDGTIIPSANQNELIVDESGEYSVETTNPDGCVSTNIINVQVNSFPEFQILQDTFVCEEEELFLNIGCDGCVYNWSNGETDSLVYIEEAGNYEVTVTNNTFQCSIVESFDLEVMTVQIALEQQYYFCDTDFPNTINAGNTINDYTWYIGNSIVGNENELEVFFPGVVYHVVVTNLQGCSASATTYVEENPPPDVPSLDNVSICEGDELFLDVTCSNNCSYFWNSGLESPTITLNETGFYEVTVIDNTTGCYAIESMNLNVIDYPTISQDTSFCNGENITLFAGNTGTEYLWYLNGTIIPSANQNELIVDESGEYSVETTNPNGCVSTNIITVQVNSFPDVLALQDTTICDYEQLTINVGCENCLYNWNTGDSDSLIYLVDAGNYEVTVTNNISQCSVVESFDLEVVTALASLDQEAYLCIGNSTTLIAGDNTNEYVWYYGNSIIGSNENELEVFIPGEYFVVVTNSQGCSASANTFVEEYILPSIPSFQDTFICEGNELLLDATCNNCSYLWNTGDQTPTISLSQTGNYEVIVSDNLTGCTAIENIYLEIIEKPNILLGQDTSLCENESILLFAGDTNNNYEWYLNGVPILNSNQNELPVNTGGNYFVEVTNSQGCTSSSSIQVEEYLSPLISGIQDSEVCENDSLVLNVFCSGCNYEWSNGDNSSSIVVNSVGLYEVTVTNSNQCSSTASMNLGVNENPVFDLGENQSICEGEELLIGVSPNNNSQYLWDIGNQTSEINVMNSGIYVLTVTNDNLCESSDSIEVLVFEEISLSIQAAQDKICIGDSILLQASGGEQYLWIIGQETLSNDSINTPLAFPEIVTNYMVISSNECFVDTAQISIDIFESFADAGRDTCIIRGSEVRLNATGGEIYEWEETEVLQSSFNIPNPTVNPLDSTWFFVNITDVNGCYFLDSVLVAVLDDPTNFIKPVNILTPNGDGSNDILEFKGLQKINNNQITIFNRWGNVVFQKVKYGNDWDGTYKGKPLPAGSYYYILKMNSFTLKSALTILRE